MKFLARSSASWSARILLLAAVSFVAVGCGGGSSDTGGGAGDEDIINSETADADLDGIPNGLDPDDDDDGLLDSEDPFTDRDFDGFDDVSGLTEDEATMAGGGDNPSNVGTDAELSCGEQAGSDAISGTKDWNDNCVLRRGATHGTSYYTRGVQRILWCLGYDEGTASLSPFADAQYGATTEAAVVAYQTAEGLTADGIVGPSTWGSLQSKLVIDSDNGSGTAGYAITGARTEDNCNQVQFYENYNPDDQSFINWRLANNPGETTQAEFTVRNPFN